MMYIIIYFSPHSYDDLLKVTQAIKTQVTLKETPKIAIICGSGLGGIADTIKQPQILPYSKIPGFPVAKGA